MTWKATARTWDGEIEIVEEFTADTQVRLENSMQDSFFSYGAGIWVVNLHPDNPNQDMKWYRWLFQTPRIRLPAKFTVIDRSDRLLVRVRHR